MKPAMPRGIFFKQNPATVDHSHQSKCHYKRRRGEKQIFGQVVPGELVAGKNGSLK